MTNHYLRNAVPDHIAGVISACEGIQNNLVLLNGPIGCKTYYTFSGVDSLIRRSNLWTLGDELRLEDAMDDWLFAASFASAVLAYQLPISAILIIFSGPPNNFIAH